MLIVGCAPSPAAPVPACVASDHFYVPRDPQRAAFEAEYIRTHPPRFSRADAISIAQRFIAAEGHTEVPGTVDEGSIHRDLVEAGSFEETMALRHANLDPHPVGVRRLPAYWAVVFRFADSYRAQRGLDEQRGRAVLVSIFDGHARVQHQDITCVASFAEP